MPKKYVPEGVYLACNKGTSPCTLRVSNNQRTTIYNVPMASELDFIPFFNIKPMGFCTCPAKIASTGATCIPGVVTPWQNPKDGVKINGSRLILEDSHNNCIFGGEIKIFFDRPSAVGFGVGEGKMPSEYIKEGFDWLEEKTEENRKKRDDFLPDWMKPVTGVKDWFEDLGTGLVEGAVNGIVGLGETIYQVAQDPVGTTEALGGMISDGASAAWNGAKTATEWASKGENWENAANGAWDWASDGENWKKAGEAAVEGTKDAADWVTKNPRKIGNTVGEFIPDAVAAVYSGGASTALSAGKVVVKEVAEVAVEKAVKETIEEGVEKAGKEALEAGVKKAGKELIESLVDDAADIARVVTRNTSKPNPPFKISSKHAGDVNLEAEFKRQLKDQQDAINNMKAKDWLQNRNDFANRNKKDYSKKAKEARDNYRQQELAKRTNEFMNPPHNKSLSEAKEAAKKSMDGQAALHNPDGVAGGKVDQITGMGDGRVNSSIGSQWDKGRAKSIEDQLKKEYGIPPKKISDIPDDEMMNVDLF
ncbi:polymorphic toxin type 15 domain-containing protein [Empedobacter tilapiae]|uniref:polymorphic toxin type 15 domain-containing protein n=1 Tax=Empedobacter tilapiae TaxID=2491114 RepID=UPI0028D6D52E|nr:polymorphic toxin type 15 domain-containing protein [Empedobacter tilapiae]